MSKAKWKDIEVSSLQEFNAETHRLTIESIQQAMNELLKTKRFKEITILDIVKKAGVSRSAFYRNYQSKEQVLQSIVHDSYAKMIEEIRATTNSGDPKFWRHIIVKEIEQCRKFYHIHSAEAWQGDTLLQCMNDYFGDMISPYANGGDEIRMRFWMGGIFNVIQFWLDNGMQETPEELADKLMHYITQS